MGDPKRDPNAKEWPGAVTRTAAMVVTGSRDYVEPRNSAWADFLALATPVRVFLDVENSTHMFADSPVTSHPAGKWMALFLRATLLDDGAAEALVFGDADPKALVNEAVPSTDLPSTPVFPPGLDNITCFRIPAIVQSASGVLLAFAEARHGSCSDGSVHEIAMRRSLDGGATWTPGVTFPVGNSSYWVGNPAAVAMDDGSVVVVYTNHDKKCTGGCGTGNGMVRTTDGGETWSSPIDLSGDFGPLAKGALPGPGTALQLSATHATHPGRLLVVSHKGAYQNDYVTVSDDNGEHWSTHPRAFPLMDEAALTELPNGHVLLNMRHRSSPQVGRAIALSMDGGDTFGNITFDKALISPVCQASIVSFDGATYFSNPADPSGRDEMTVKKSVDNARTWTSSLLVHAGPSFGYSCLVKGELLRGSARQGGILFESANEEIAFARFGLDF